MTVLVTGGAGFIGSHLCQSLLSQGKQVLCLDNFVTGQKQNLTEFADSSDFELVEVDLQSFDWKKEYGRLDQIYHLASPASPVDFDPLWLEIIQANVYGTQRLLKLAQAHQAKILFASTSEVYGDPQQHPQSEEYWGNVNPVGQRSCYDESKRVGETLVANYVRHHQVEARIVRIFNTYGPRMRTDDGRSLIEFVVRASKNEPLPIFGAGTQTRSFCYVADLVTGLMMIMEEEVGWQPINLGSDDEISILELARLVIKLTGSDSKPQHLPARPDDPQRRRPDLTKVRRRLGWMPKTSLTNGLKQTIKSLKRVKS